MNKAVFLDRDGTLNYDKGHTHRIDDFRLIEGVLESLKILNDSGFKLIIVTNQPGVGRGLFSFENYLKFKNYMHEKLKENGITISAEYFCPHHPEHGIGNYKIICDCRKPGIRMFLNAKKDFDLNLKECWMIGDKISDIKAGKNAGCKTIHVLTGVEKNPILFADFVAKNLIESAKFILQNTNK